MAATSRSTEASATRARLRRYRDKRDFAVTAEPSGTAPPRADGHRFVVQRHRARRLHYDLRLEAAGVLVSWAVPKGPTLDPDVRRMAVHVEDHPLDYYDFEGVIPPGEYGGGDVVVWDWGTWTLAESDDPLAAIEAGNLHFDLAGEKLGGRFVLVRTRGDKDWMLIKKHDDAAVPGWETEDHPRSVKSGRTNDEVKEAPSASWTGRVSWAPPTADELVALDAMGVAGDWTLGDHTVSLRDLDEVVIPKRGRRPAVTKRDLVRHHASAAPVMLPYLADRPVDISHPVPAGTPEWLRRWTDGGADAGRASEHLVIDSPAALAWAADAGAVELRPWTSTVDDPGHPTWALIAIAPGVESTFEDVLVVARLHRTALEHLGVDGRPMVTGTGGIDIWIPVADGTTFAQSRSWVETVTGAIGATVPDIVGAATDGDAASRLVTLDGSRNAMGATLVAPFGSRAASGAPVAVAVAWDELDDSHLPPDGWTIATVGARIAAAGDPLAPLVGRQQRLPQLQR